MNNSHEVIRFLIEDVLAFHEALQEISKMMPEVRDMALLESAVNTPFQICFGKELYPDIFSKAARLCYGITENHPFYDGNKRTALHTMLVYLKVNGVELTFDDKEMEKVIIDVASGKINDVQLCHWLKKHRQNVHQRLISIVLPVYNGARYLRESIESVLRQTVEDWELIVVDDCSTDDSRAIAEAYAAKDARIRVLHNERNAKLPRSLNAGFRAARGEYLTWTSDDNRYLPQALERMRAYLAAHPEVPIVSARAYAIDAAGARFQGAPFPDGMMPPPDGARLFCVNSMGACFLYRRAVAAAVGGYDPTLFGCEDYDYWLRILEQTPRLGTLPDVLYEYRWHAQSLTQTKRAMIWERLYALREKHWRYIVRGLASQPQCAVQIFLEMSRVRRLARERREDLIRAVPALRGFVPLASAGRFLVYGAGQCGRAFAAAHAFAVCCFADRSEAMWGKDIDGVPVLSLSAARAAYPEAQVVLAGGVPVAGSMMASLWAQGMRTFAYCEPLYL